MNRTFEPPSVELVKQVFQSSPQTQHEALASLFSCVLPFFSDLEKTIKREAETQTELSHFSGKKKRSRRRRKRKEKVPKIDIDKQEVEEHDEGAEVENTFTAVSDSIPHKKTENIPPTLSCDEGVEVENTFKAVSDSIPLKKTENIPQIQLSVETQPQTEDQKSTVRLSCRNYRKRYSRSRSSSSSSFSSRSSSRSSLSSRSRSPPIRRRGTSPSFLSSRRITSARRLPVTYCRRSPNRGRRRRSRRRSRSWRSRSWSMSEEERPHRKKKLRRK